MRLIFDWDTRKDESNQLKHGVSFDEAMNVFQDRLALSIFDDDHSEAEDPWVTLGMSVSLRLLLVVHTHVEITADEVLIRIISARRSSRKEIRQYEEGVMP